MDKKRPKGKGIIVVALFVISLAAFSGDLMAKERKGADIAVMKKDGNPVSGELIAVKQEALLIKEEGTQADVSIGIGDVKYIKLVGKSHAGKGALIGLLAGGALGLALDASGGSSSSGKNGMHFPLLSAGLVGGIGALVGVLAGAASSGKDKEIQIEGLYKGRINGILEELRSRARVPGF